MHKYTVIYLDPISQDQYNFNCTANNSEHAALICQQIYPQADVIWVNEGFFNLESWEEVE